MENKIFRQSKFLGKWFGNLQIVAQQMNIYIQIGILSFSSIAAYGVISTGTAQRGYNLPFWAFAAICILILLIGCTIVWKFTIHSTFASWNYQWWHHDNPLRPKIEQMELDIKELKELKSQLDRIEKRINNGK